MGRIVITNRTDYEHSVSNLYILGTKERIVFYHVLIRRLSLFTLFRVLVFYFMEFQSDGSLKKIHKGVDV